MIGTALPMALRWQWLMRAQGMEDTFGWLTRAYLVSYTASQVLPTSIGGDAMRVYETARRHPGRTADVTAIILLERGLGGAGDRPARRDRVPAGARHLRRRRVPVARGGIRLRDDRADLPLLRPFRSPAPRAGRSRFCAGSASTAPCARSTTGCTTSAAMSAARRRLRLHDGDPGGARFSRSGRPASPSGSSSGRGSTT